MDTPIEEQKIFQNVTCKIAAKEHEITEPDMLSVEFIAHVSYRIFEIIVTISFPLLLVLLLLDFEIVLRAL